MPTLPLAAARRARRLLAIATIAILFAAACSTGASGTPGPATPGASPTPQPTSNVGEIEHATGATDLILRLEEGGGFVPPGFLVTQAPIFSLFGDGTVIMRNDRSEEPPPESNDGVIRDRVFTIARLNEDQVQRLLLRALGEGRLGLARPRYDNPLVADAPTATFTVRAGGVNKTVDVIALGMEMEQLPDQEVRSALSKLADHLRTFDTTSSLTFATWNPERYRGILLDDGGPIQGGAPAIDWPWTDIAPADFVPPAPDVFPNFPRRTLSAVDVTALGLDDLLGGAQGIVLRLDADARYNLALRPLLPDEPG